VTGAADALFERNGVRVVATELSRGPWDPAHCHGGPVSALLAGVAEQVEPDAVDAWQVARLTVELIRPVPVGRPLTLAVEVERPGRKVSLVAATLCDGDSEVARLRALRIRTAALDLPADAVRVVDVPLPDKDSVADETPDWAMIADVAFHSHACQHRFVEGSWNEPGPIAAWIRLRYPLFAGVEPSGVQRVMAAADFGNGVSASLPYEEWVFINPDLTVHLLRPPTGEWIGLRTASRYERDGAGLAESELFDGDGRIGRSCQSLFVDQR
jgi:Acyl-CoA thioesterase C-terminal domain/Acyl-CoA thioesterase N-terminal domain